MRSRCAHAAQADGYRELLRAYGYDKPLWLTETGISSEPTGPEPWRQGTMAVQARWVVEATVSALARGVEKVIWHSLVDTDPAAVAVSLTLPLRPEPYEWPGLHPFFENLLPEGWLLEIATTKLKISSNDAFGLLLATCALVERLGFNNSTCALGPGSASYVNTVIGRALRLILMNIGQAYPGKMDMDTIGTANKYSFCVAENAAKSPWQPWNVEKGYSPETSTLSIALVYPGPDVLDWTSTTPEGFLDTLASLLRAETRGQAATRVYVDTGAILERKFRGSDALRVGLLADDVGLERGGLVHDRAAMEQGHGAARGPAPPPRPRRRAGRRVGAPPPRRATRGLDRPAATLRPRGAPRAGPEGRSTHAPTRSAPARRPRATNAQHEMHAVVLSWKSARVRMLDRPPAQKPTLH